MPEKRICAGCGKDYWLPARWQHDKCVVVHKPDFGGSRISDGGSQASGVVVHDRRGDRHRQTDERKAYRREWMRQRRKQTKVAHG